jgi:hypothetical protein
VNLAELIFSLRVNFLAVMFRVVRANLVELNVVVCGFLAVMFRVVIVNLVKLIFCNGELYFFS